MSNKRILYVCQEIMPYLPETPMSNISRNLPQAIQERGFEIRTFMPRYGSVNERRNQLHEVIRLSGMNLIIDDNDHQLIIKVASIPTARVQIYFIDNEEYFQRKCVLQDEAGNYYPDNDERAIFFARGVIETVKKLRWSPGIVHVQGWFAGFIAMYLKGIFAEDPLFAGVKIVVSLYPDDFTGTLDLNVAEKLKTEGARSDTLPFLADPTYENVMKFIGAYADGVVYAQPGINEAVKKYYDGLKIPVLEMTQTENYADSYAEFYEKILS
ncbi:MAG: glycogen/starch synthase [Rikenellaceae bacterium]|nr:glycogen/starch synthase [Rikenellaceae bacterium]